MTDDEPISVYDWEANMPPLADTSIVIMSTTVLEDWVTSATKTKMRRLSSNLNERIFRGYGPLSTFSAKIDIGYALELYDKTIHRDLRGLKDIRNAFAHTADPLHFKSEAVAKEFQKLNGWTKDIHPHQLFRDRVRACVDALKVPMQKKALIDALIRYHPDANNKRRATLLGEFEQQSPQPQPHDQDDIDTGE